jgi:hypothetical protein
VLTSLLAVPVFPGVEGLSLDMSFQVDIRDYVNKELALRIHTDIDSQGTFFTDLNGFQVILGAHGTELILLMAPKTGAVWRGGGPEDR